MVKSISNVYIIQNEKFLQYVGMGNFPGKFTQRPAMPFNQSRTHFFQYLLHHPLQFHIKS